MATIPKDKDRFDAGKRRKNYFPGIVTIPTGDYQVDENGALKLDDDGEPLQTSKNFIVNRSGTQLKVIMQREADMMMAYSEEDREELADLEKEPEEQQITERMRDEQARKRGEEQFEFTYWSLAQLLLDPATREATGKMSSPDPKWLEDHLDFDVASEWIQVLIPRGVPAPAREGDEEAEVREESPTVTG
jgi:hypothetical protein